MFIDLDRFKIVNDSLGHQAGDALLKVVSRRIHACLRGSDLLFRVGGDEFTVILPEIASPDDAAFVARRILSAVAQPVTLHGNEVAVGATIGIAVHPGDGDTTQALLKNADAAMYNAKDSGRGRYAFYRAEMNRSAQQRSEIEDSLHRAWREGQIGLRYQPRLHTSGLRTVTLEASLHWSSPVRGAVGHAELVGMLEDAGMAAKVGDWALRLACIQAARWQSDGAMPLRVSIPVTPVQFHVRDFAEGLQRLLHETGAWPASIELELAESALSVDSEQAQSTIAALKTLGVRIAIDGFGAGGLSFNQLLHTPFDCLKLEAGFASTFADSARDRALVTAVVDLARALGVTVVAAGVRTQAQADFYTSLQCDELQGPLYGEPLPAGQLDPLVTVPA